MCVPHPFDDYGREILLNEQTVLSPDWRPVKTHFYPLYPLSSVGPVRLGVTQALQSVLYRTHHKYINLFESFADHFAPNKDTGFIFKT
jgi:hypothetical protein